MTFKVDLVQPRHNYAPEEGQGHIYLPTSLLTAGARLLSAGIDVEFHDENLAPYEPTSHHVGINLLGAPYIPEAMKLQERIERETGEKHTYFLGGQVVSGLTDEQFHHFFGERAHNGNDDTLLEKVLQIPSGALPAPEKTSLVPAYKKLSDGAMREYLSREIGLYISNGCKYSCSFCAARRTSRDPFTGELKVILEEYRDPAIIRDDLRYLIARSQRLGIDGLELYLSNLDVFQNPPELLAFARAVKEVETQGFSIGMRGLATTRSFLQARKHHQRTIEEFVGAGFHTAGFGIDGMTAKVWRKVNKAMNTEDACLETIRSSREDFGITPEALMVFGHPDADTQETLRLAFDFTLDMRERYGAVPRPHVSKTVVPGNDGWRKGHEREVELFIRHPAALQSLDFTALPSPLTHPDAVLRESAAKTYLEICGIPSCTTQYVLPIVPGMSDAELAEVKRFNEGRYDR